MHLSTQQVKKYQETLSRARSWVMANYTRLETESDLQSHYKAPYFWASMGDMEMAGRHIRIIQDRFLRDDGDFRMGENEKGFVQFQCTLHNQYIYPNGWIISGLRKLGAYDLARKGMSFILPFQDPKSGGFYRGFDPVRKLMFRDLMDSSSTSSAGMACLACGMMPEAERAGDFILRLLELQPQPDRYFFSCMTPDGRVHTDVFRSENQWDPESRKQKCLSTESDAGNELTWLIGKPNKFLSRLYTATGNTKYLDGARQCFKFFHRLEKNAWTNFASCKTMWAGAELYRMTGEKEFADVAIRILDHYCAAQTKSGTWVHTLWYKSEEEQTFSWSADITLEYGAEISDVLFDLCMCDKQSGK